MQPVELEGSRVNGNQVAGGNIAYGASVQYSAAGEVVATVTGANEDQLSCAGIAVDDNVENEDNKGFYEDGDLVPLVVGGPARVWLLGGQTVVFGDFLQLSTSLGDDSANLGVFIEETTGTTRTVATRARVFGTSAGSADYDQAITTAESGSKTVTFGAGLVATLGVAVDDYVVIDDDDAAEINRVTAVGSTTITLQNAMTATYDATPICYLLKQIEVELI